MLLQIDEQQTKEFYEHEYEQDIADHQRKISALNQELAKVKKFYSHGHKQHRTQAKHDAVLD